MINNGGLAAVDVDIDLSARLRGTHAWLTNQNESEHHFDEVWIGGNGALAIDSGNNSISLPSFLFFPSPSILHNLF